MKGQNGIMGIIIGGISVVILLVIIVNVVMPQLIAPTRDHALNTATGAVSATNINSTTTTGKYVNFTGLTYLYTGQSASVVFAYQANAGKINVTTPDDSTLIATFDGTTPDTVVVSAANMAKSCTATTCRLNFTSITEVFPGYNVTAGTLTYAETTTATQQGWTGSETNIWEVLGIFVILGALVFIAVTFIMGAGKF